MLRFCTAFVLALAGGTGPATTAPADPSGVVRVIDADTWDIGGVRVRLFGIDAPELDQTCNNAQGRDWACGVWASEQARARYDRRIARCEAVTTDRYGRTVARCFVGNTDVARDLVADGLAFAYRRYSMDYDLDEKGASVNNRGLHASQMQSPSDYRAARRVGQAAPDHDCTIKGNLSSGGARIYHLPGQRDYGRTRINAAKGERWFCTEQEARAAGWRRARR